MKLRRTQPALPCGRFADPMDERLATEFARGRQTTPFAPHLPQGVLARLLARKKRLLRPTPQGPVGLRRRQLPLLGKFPNLSIGQVDRYQTGNMGYWRPLTARRR